MFYWMFPLLCRSFWFCWGPKFILAFVSFAFGDISWKELLWLISKRLLPMFSSGIRMDSCLTLRSFIHFEFIFVYSVRKWSSFILLHIAVQFSQYHLLKSTFSDHKALKLELNHKEKFWRNSNTWKLKNTLLKNAWINQIKEQLKQFMETNENEDNFVQNLWDTAKVVLRGKYIAIQASLKKIEECRTH